MWHFFLRSSASEIVKAIAYCRIEVKSYRKYLVKCSSKHQTLSVYGYIDPCTHDNPRPQWTVVYWQYEGIWGLDRPTWLPLIRFKIVCQFLLIQKAERTKESPVGLWSWDQQSDSNWMSILLTYVTPASFFLQGSFDDSVSSTLSITREKRICRRDYLLQSLFATSKFSSNVLCGVFSHLYLAILTYTSCPSRWAHKKKMIFPWFCRSPATVYWWAQESVSRACTLLERLAMTLDWIIGESWGIENLE